MLVATLQLDVREDDVAANLAAVEAGLARAAERGVRLVVLPEMWPTSFPGAGGAHPGEGDPLAASERAVERLRELTGELGLAAVGSAYGRGARESEGERPANRLHLFDRGALALAYDKVHLFTPTAEHETFRAGDAPPAVAEVDDLRVTGAVCYDLRFPELTRLGFLDGAELLACPAQWPATRAAHMRALAVGRAVENQCFVALANRTGRAVIGRRRLELGFSGNSLVVAPDGTVLAEGPGGTTGSGLLLAEVDPAACRALRRSVPVARDRRPDLYARWAAERATPEREQD